MLNPDPRKLINREIIIIPIMISRTKSTNSTKRRSNPSGFISMFKPQGSKARTIKNLALKILWYCDTVSFGF